MDGMLLAMPAASFGLGVGAAPPLSASSPAGAPAVRGQAFFPTAGGRGFFRSAEFGLILGLLAVVYIDGRVLPRKR